MIACVLFTGDFRMNAECKILWNNIFFSFFVVNGSVRLKLIQDGPYNRTIVSPIMMIRKIFSLKKILQCKVYSFLIIIDIYILFYYFIQVHIMFLSRFCKKDSTPISFRGFFNILPWPLYWCVVVMFTVNYKSLMV